jgi:hypothetical protein
MKTSVTPNGGALPRATLLSPLPLVGRRDGPIAGWGECFSKRATLFSLSPKRGRVKNFAQLFAQVAQAMNLQAR